MPYDEDGNIVVGTLEEHLTAIQEQVSHSMRRHLGNNSITEEQRNKIKAALDKALPHNFNIGEKMKKAVPQKMIKLETECVRCGCPLMDHQENRGACRRCTAAMEGSYRSRICNRFCTREDINVIKFFEFFTWAKKWVKTKRSRSIGQLRQVWDRIGYDDTYCMSCSKCKTSIVMNNATSKTILKKQDGLACLSCKSCIDCCKCVPCERCNRKVRTDTLCSECHMCGGEGRCCHCRTCDGCSKPCGDDYCHDGTGNGCGYCNTCCRCPDKYRVPFYTSYNRKTKFYTPSLKDHSFNITSRFIATEIEVAAIKGHGRNIYNKVKDWQAAVVRDGSLPAGGFEINTAPAGGDLYVKQVNELCKVIIDEQGIVNDRCGLHIHVDARDLTYYDLRRLIRIYAVIEDTLFAMVNPKRRGSRYCLPCGHKYIAAIEEGRLPYDKVKADVITSVYHARTTQDNRHSKYNNARYNALNLHSWFYRGTIECRMFDGTIDPDLISKWGILWAMILDYVMATNDESIARLINTNSGFAVLATIAAKDEKILDFVRRRVLEFGDVKVGADMRKYNNSLRQ